MKTIPMPQMEQEFYKGFIGWVYSCITTEAIITYRAGEEIREIHVCDPMWLVNCSAKDIECLFINKIHYQPADREQAQQFHRVVSLCFQKSINSESKWKSSWWSLDEKMKRKANHERQKLAEKKGTFMKMQAEEEKARKKENEKIRVALSRKPKPREEINEYADESDNPFREDYYKKAIYHQNKSEPPRLKQIEEKGKEKSRALAVIHDDEGYDWSEILPEEDAVGYAFAAGKIVPFKDTRTEEEKFVNRRMKAQTKVSRIYTIYKEAKLARRWDPDRECYLDPQGNITIDPSSLSVDAIIQQYAEEEEARQREWWGGTEKKVEEKEENVKSAEKKIDDGLIDTSQELTAENLMKMEVDSSSGTKSNGQVSQINKEVSGKKEVSESDCKNCKKNCKECSTIAYLNNKKVEDLTKRVREVENQILNRDKLLKASNDHAKECNHVGHIARKCTNLKPKTEVVESQRKKDVVKGKAPLIVEKKVVKKENTKVKIEPVKKLMSAPLDHYEKLEKVKSISEKWVAKKDQPSGQPKKDKLFTQKEVEVESKESLKLNDKNFPPLYTTKSYIKLELPKSKEAWDLPQLVSRWIMDSGASRHMM
ncbi:triadin-like [Helianthus annuus]|uniref:triadin-like n=1 Tax=Helianthus annuus TaxID=4232 RepID=UPI000B8F693A|nr:triadin-like [Helianthus annuus]